MFGTITRGLGWVTLITPAYKATDAWDRHLQGVRAKREILVNARDGGRTLTQPEITSLRRKSLETGLSRPVLGTLKWAVLPIALAGANAGFWGEAIDSFCHAGGTVQELFAFQARTIRTGKEGARRTNEAVAGLRKAVYGPEILKAGFFTRTAIDILTLPAKTTAAIGGAIGAVVGDAAGYGVQKLENWANDARIGTAQNSNVTAKFADSTPYRQTITSGKAKQAARLAV